MGRERAALSARAARWASAGVRPSAAAPVMAASRSPHAPSPFGQGARGHRDAVRGGEQVGCGVGVLPGDVGEQVEIVLEQGHVGVEHGQVATGAVDETADASPRPSRPSESAPRVVASWSGCTVRSTRSSSSRTSVSSTASADRPRRRRRPRGGGRSPERSRSAARRTSGRRGWSAGSGPPRRSGIRSAASRRTWRSTRDRPSSRATCDTRPTMAPFIRTSPPTLSWSPTARASTVTVTSSVKTWR